MAYPYPTGESDPRNPSGAPTYVTNTSDEDIARQLQEEAARRGVTYDPSDLEGIRRNTSYTDAAGNPTGMSLEQALQNQFNVYGQRANNSPGGGGGSSPNYQTPAQQWNSQPPAQSNPRADDFYNLLMSRIQQGTNVGRSDPNVRAQVDPGLANIERSQRSYLDNLAEQSGPLANLQGERRLAAERAGQQGATLESQVIGREMDARRQEISQALQLYGGMLSDEQRNSLQRELAYLSDATQRRGQDIGFDSFLRELALRQWQAQDDSAYRWGGLGG